MAGPFKQGLVFAFSFSALLYLAAALATWRGGPASAEALAGAEPAESRN